MRQRLFLRGTLRGSSIRGALRQGPLHSSSWWQSQLHSWQQRTCTPTSQGLAALVGSVITRRTPRHRRRCVRPRTLRYCSHSARPKRRTVTGSRPRERLGTGSAHEGLLSRQVAAVQDRHGLCRRRRRRPVSGGRAGRGTPRGSRRGGSTAVRGGWSGPTWGCRPRPTAKAGRHGRLRASPRACPPRPRGGVQPAVGTQRAGRFSRNAAMPSCPSSLAK